MSFDSHLLRVLEASVSLVNAVVAGEAQGRPFVGPPRTGCPAPWATR